LPPPADDDLAPRGFDQEEADDLRYQFLRQDVRVAIAFATVFAGVYFALWWSSAAVRFGAARAAGNAAASWHVFGTVRDAGTGAPVAWASIEDDPVTGHPPFFRADADLSGVFDLVTVPTSHRVRVLAPGYRPETIAVGRPWFFWLPAGKERREIRLTPE
jgi:hypothetical protein